MPTKQDLAEEKKYALTREIREIEYKGKVSKDKNTIEVAFVEHFEQLFGEKPTPVGFSKFNEFLSVMPKLNEEVKIWLEGEIALEEIRRAIDSLARQKTPGPDGLCAEFYQTFKEAISPVLLSVFNESYENHSLPLSFAEAHTVLIPKSEDKVKKLSVTGYRPITLCNIDYKIFTKIITRRLQSVIGTLIGDHQTCGIRGRSIQTNIHVARSIFETVGRGRVAMVQLDLEKAFDKVRHDVIKSI